MKKRFAVIIGAPHAGTTRLFGLLGAHPQVLPCRVKAPRFFTDDRKWELGIEWYRSLWDFREPDERLALEASTDYACHPRTPSPAGRIARTPAGFRFLYLLRDPVERIAAERAADPDVDGRHDLARYLDASRYAAQLDQYACHFSKSDVLLLPAEDLGRDALARVSHFLEIDPSFDFPDPGTGTCEPVRNGRGSWLERLRRRLAGPFPAPFPPEDALPPALREAAHRALRDDLARLEGEWGFDVSRWRLGEPTPTSTAAAPGPM